MDFFRNNNNNNNLPSSPPPFVNMGFFRHNNSDSSNNNMMSSSSNDMSNHASASSQFVRSKIMVVAVAVLFAAVVFIICLHVYAKWFWRHQATAVLASSGSSSSWRWRRRRRASSSSSSSRRSNSSSEPLAGNHGTQQQQQVLFLLHSMGLDKSVVESLPTFVYKKKPGLVLDAAAAAASQEISCSLPQRQQQQLECVVCLEEFQENETCRRLPKCDHFFHLECIDMWLHSHSTCPLCRASARPDVGPAATHKQLLRAHAAAGTHEDGDRENASSTTISFSHHDHHDQIQSSVGPDLQSLAIAAAATTVASGRSLSTTSSAAAAAATGGGLQAPFHVVIDIPPPRGDRGGSIAVEPSSSPFSTPKSPMARFSSLKRLLSRGKTVAAAAAASPSPPSSSSSSSSSLADLEQAPAPSPTTAHS